MKIKFLLSMLFILIFIFNLNVYAEPENVCADAAILIDYKNGRILWSKNASKPLPMASTTKIMTAVLTLENADLNDIVTVSSKAAAAPEVKMKLRTGEKIKLEYLMYALMLQSSNDAAVAIAEHVGGDTDNFCKLMTEKANEIGCSDTIFETPNGLDKGNHHSTAADMAIIARYALKNDKFRKIIATPEMTFKSDKTTYYVVNKDRLLREYNGAIGVKTGFTGKAGHCFVGAAKRGDITLISVVLASGWGNKGKEQKWKDTKEILDYGFNNYRYYNIVNENDLAGTTQVKNSKTTSVNGVFETGINTILNENEYKNIKIEKNIYNCIDAPLKKGQIIGKAEIYTSNECLGEINIIAENSAERFDFNVVIKKIFKCWLETFCGS